MSRVIIAALLLENDKDKAEKIKRRLLRDRSNPLELSYSAFIAQFRVNKAAFFYILNEVEQHLRPSSISPMLQLAATLRFLAEGRYQRSVEIDAGIALGRSTISKLLTNMLKTLELRLCPKWIKMTQDEFNQTKIQFFEKFGIPGIVGCIDGTHVRLTKPFKEENIYYNRKGYFSINVMIICDYNMKILAVDACHPGSSHDSFIWNLSCVRQFFLAKFQAGERRTWLLGDGGYGVEPYLLVPYRDPEVGSMQHKFNIKHASARNVVERTIGELKSRFRCLLESLPYQPQKVVKMINVCCALHNICRFYNVENNSYDDNDLTTTAIDYENPTYTNTSLQNEGKRIRDEIANAL